MFSLFGSVRADYIRNEDKFSKRAKRSISIFDFSEETEEHHTEIASNELEEEAISNEMAKQVQAAIAQLKPIQRERLIKYFFEGKTLLQIAAEEGKSYSTVYESYQTALFTLDDGTGTDRTILSGIHSFYEPEELVGKTLIAITNLPPRAMMGIDSCGMLLSAIHEEEGEEKLHLLMVDDHIPAGAKLY